MKITPESELKKYSQMLEYWKKTPEGHETTIKHLISRINYIKSQVRNKKLATKYQKKLNYINKKANEAR